MWKGGKHLPVNNEEPHVGKQHFTKLASRGNKGLMSGDKFGSAGLCRVEIQTLHLAFNFGMFVNHNTTKGFHYWYNCTT